MSNDKRAWSPPQMIWGAILGIVAWTAIGFGWFGTGFGWMTEGSAMRMSSTAVVERLATICVAQAKDAPGASSAIAKLSGLSTWKRREFVENEGWAKLPGSEKADSSVAERCAAKLIET